MKKNSPQRAQRVTEEDETSSVTSVFFVVKSSGVGGG